MILEKYFLTDQRIFFSGLFVFVFKCSILEEKLKKNFVLKVEGIQILEDILISFLGEPKERYGNELEGQRIFNCPRCAEENGGIPDGKYNLEITFEKGLLSRGGLFNCWKCGAYHDEMSGSVYKLIKHYGSQDLLKEYKSIVKQIKECKYYDLNIFGEDEAAKAIAIDDVQLPQSFKKIDIATEKDEKLVSYLKQRKITQDIIDFYRIGYTTKDENTWQMRNRLIIPSYNSNGDLNYWVGRDYMGYTKKFKYKNCKNDKNKIIFNEGKVNFNGDIILVEGIIDSIYYHNAIPLMGKVLSKDSELYRVLKEKANANIVICLDSDTDIYETKKIYNLLNTGRLRGKIKYIRMKEYKDFGEVYESMGKKGIINLMNNEKEFTEFELVV